MRFNQLSQSRISGDCQASNPWLRCASPCSRRKARAARALDAITVSPAWMAAAITGGSRIYVLYRKANTPCCAGITCKLTPCGELQHWCCCVFLVRCCRRQPWSRWPLRHHCYPSAAVLTVRMPAFWAASPAHTPMPLPRCAERVALTRAFVRSPPVRSLRISPRADSLALSSST
jgi:hypothetical protein